MRKTTKKLLSSTLAGLFVLSSLPLMGAAEAGDNKVLNHAPVIDGVLDSEYADSCSVKLNTALKAGMGENAAIDGTAYYLWNDGYIYMAAVVTGDDNVGKANDDWPDSVSFEFFKKGEEQVEAGRLLVNVADKKFTLTNVNGTAMGGDLAVGTAYDATDSTECAVTAESGKYVVEARIKAASATTDGTTYSVNFGVLDGQNYAVIGNYTWAGPADGDIVLSADKPAVVPDDTSAPVTEPATDAPVDPPVEDADSALKFTPVLDGVKDEAYDASYTVKTATSELSFLYDSKYIYVYADIENSTVANNNNVWSFGLAAGKAGTDAYKNLDNFNKGFVSLVSNINLDDYVIRHWDYRIYGTAMTGYKTLGMNLGWQDMGGETIPADITPVMMNNSPATEYSKKTTETNTIIEFRIEQKDFAKGDSFSVSADANTDAIYNIFTGAEGKYTIFTLGDEYKSDVPDDTSAPVTDTPTDPVTDAPTDPVTDTPTEPDTDAPVDPDPETSTIDGVKDSYYNDENVLTNAAGTLYYAPVKTDGVPELHCYIEVPASAEKVLFHIMNDGDAFWQGSATLTVNVKEDTGIYAFIFGGVSEDIGSGPVMDNKTDQPVNNFAVKTIDGDKIAVEFAVPSSQIVSGKEYYAAFGVDADGVIDWSTVYNSGNVAGGTGTKIVLGELVDLNGETPVDPKPETNVIKKGTPVLDGKLDSKYLDSAVYKTLDAAKAGNITLYGWINPEQKKLQELVTNGALKVTGPGAYEIGENVEAFAHAETYFLWDDDALYIFSKVYDDSIFELNEETVNNMVNNNINDTPWINDSIAHVINLDGIPLHAQGIGHLNPQGTAGGYGIFDRSGMGYSTIGTFMTAAGNENVSGTVGDGYYTVEMRIPTTDKDDTIKNLLKDGGSFSYDYWLYDTDDDKMGSWYNHESWIHTMSAESVKYTLSDVAAEGKDPEPGDSTTTEKPEDPEIPEENIIKKGTPELDGVLDGKYLKSAVYRTIDSAKAGKSEFGGWINPSQAKRQALIVAGVMSVEDSKLTVTENSNFGVSAFAKSETYFLWDDDALYIFSTVYDEDPMAYTGETASALNNGIFDYTQWMDDNIIHRIVTKSGVADLIANAGGELLADNKINNAASYENPTLTSILGYYRNENAENVRGIVESDRYTIEMRIPFLDSVKADVLKDGAEIGYGYRIIDGDSGRLTGNSEPTWLSIMNNGFDSGLTATTLVLSDEVVEDPEVTTDPTPTDTVVPPDDTETDPFVSDTKEPDVSDTKEPDVSDTKEPDVSDTKEPDVSDTDEPTPDNLGDVTGDGVVNAKDLIRLMKFIAGEDVEIVGTSDINGDKNTNAKDLVALMKLIAAAE